MMADVEQLLRELVPAWEQAVQAGRKVTSLPTAATSAAPAAQLRLATA